MKPALVEGIGVTLSEFVARSAVQLAGDVSGSVAVIDVCDVVSVGVGAQVDLGDGRAHESSGREEPFGAPTSSGTLPDCSLDVVSDVAGAARIGEIKSPFADRWWCE